MATRTNGQPGDGYEFKIIGLDEAMRAFDQLPRQFRDILNYEAVINTNPINARDGVRAYGTKEAAKMLRAFFARVVPGYEPLGDAIRHRCRPQVPERFAYTVPPIGRLRRRGRPSYDRTHPPRV